MLLVIGDAHIRENAKIWVSDGRIYGDVLFAIRQIVEYIRKFKIRSLILAGDTFDCQKLASSQVEIFKELVSDEIRRVYYIQGQHDQSEPPWFELFRDCRCEFLHLHRRVFDIDGIKVTGLDWLPSHYKAALHDLPPADIAILHYPWKELIYNSEVSFFDIPKRYRLVLSGDIHTPQRYSLKGMLISLLGSVYPTEIREFGIPKYVYLIDESLKLRPLPLKTRQFFKCEYLDSLSELQSWLSSLPPYNPDDLPKNCGNVHIPIVRLVCTYRFRETVSLVEIHDQLREKFGEYFLRCDVMAKNDILISQHPSVGFADVENFLLQKFDGLCKKYPNMANEIQMIVRGRFSIDSVNSAVRLLRSKMQDVETD
ncbi:MAG: metallophosphoesterase [Desulfurococcaceae archaeon]